VKSWKIVTGVVLISLVIMGLWLGLSYFSYSNKEIGLRNQLKAQQQSVQVVFDNTWKIISQTAEVSDQYKQTFSEVYPKIMEGRYGDPKERKGALLSFITESNPQFDTKLYEKVAVAIEAQRTIFTNEQKTLIDMKREHDNLRQLFPGSMFLASRTEFEIKLVTSSKTEKSFETGKDDDTKLFGK
jgi:hypothetical protein